MPDDALRWRLFHLAVLGELLVLLRDERAVVTSKRPLSGASNGPSYEVTGPDNRVWDLWFEAAGAWSYYRRSSPYRTAVEGVPGAGRAIGADLLLIRPDEFAVLFECKFSNDPQVVARAGYEQALAYLTETVTGLTPRASALVVGPEEVVEERGRTVTAAGTVDVVSPTSMAAALASVLGWP